MTGIPATTAMMIRVGASRIQASRPWPSLSAFFLCLWPSPPVAGRLRGSAVAVRHAATSFEKCAEFSAQHSAAPRTLRTPTT